MKDSNNSFALLSFAVVLVFLFQSCSVGGLLVGSVMDTNDKYNYDIPLKSGEGWVVPDNHKHNAELLLINGKIVKGKYIGTEQVYDGENFTDAILLETKVVNKRIPVDMIAYTNYYKENKNHTRDGFFVGLGIDLVAIIAILAAGGGSVGPTITMPAWN